MPSNLDILAASDFSRNPFLETIVRRPRGAAKGLDVSAVVEMDSAAAGSVNSADGGLEQTSDRLQKTRGALIEVAADEETAHDDIWEFDGTTWRAVGEPTGKDGGSKTLALRSVSRIRGRRPQVNNEV